MADKPVSRRPKPKSVEVPQVRVVKADGEEVPVMNGRADGTVIDLAPSESSYPQPGEDGPSGLVTIASTDAAVASDPTYRLLDGITLVATELMNAANVLDPSTGRTPFFRPMERSEVYFGSGADLASVLRDLPPIPQPRPLPSAFVSGMRALAYRCRLGCNRMQNAIRAGGGAILDREYAPGTSQRSIHIGKLVLKVESVMDSIEACLIVPGAVVDQYVQVCRELRTALNEIREDIIAVMRVKGVAPSAQTSTRATPRSPDRTTPRPRPRRLRDRFKVDMKRQQAIIDGVEFPIATQRACLILYRLAQAEGHLISGEALSVGGQRNERVDRIVAALPDEVRSCVKAARGKGYWIEMA